MIGFSIMMWFVSSILCITGISLLRGNTSSMHGKVYETTEDRIGYAKASGKLVIFMAFGMLACGAVAFIGTTEDGITYAMLILLIVLIISGYFFYRIQKKFSKKNEK